jgi:hypothetical protein
MATVQPQVRNGILPPQVFADLAGPDPIAAQAELDPDGPELVKKDDTLIGRLGQAEQLVAELVHPPIPVCGAPGRGTAAPSAAMNWRCSTPPI